MRMAQPLKLGVIVHCPSPHQKILLDQLYRVPDTDVLVAYAYPTTPNRNWGTPIAEGRTVMVPEINTLTGGKQLRDWLAGLDRDVWVLGSAFPYARTQALASALQRLGLPWAYLGEPPRPRSGIRALVRDFLLQRVLGRCDGVIATGSEAARRYRRLLGDGRPVTSVTYYIPLDEWLSLPLTESPALGEPIRFLTLAQLIERKGLDILVEACSLLPPKGWTLEIFGEGPDRQSLQRMIDERKLPITLNRPLPFETRVSAFRGRHCFVFPSRWDGWGMAPVEALAAGLPVIASEQVMSAHEFIKNGKNGFITCCEPSAIATAMKSILDNRSAIAGQSRAARDSIAGFRPEKGAAEFVSFCRQLIEGTERPVSR
jgi:glycosyltransferase involved in cell wall biosynthesis